MPRGFLHSAEAQEELSAHLTIGVVTTTWHDVVRDLVAGIADEPEFRRALPAGYANEPAAALAPEVDEVLARLRKWLEGVDGEAVAARATRRFVAGRPPILVGQLRQLALVEGLDDGTVLRRREGSVCLVVGPGEGGDGGDGRLTVVLGTRELRMPAALEPVMRRIAASGPFRLGDLGDALDGPSRLVLGRRLVVEGLLEIVPVG